VFLIATESEQFSGQAVHFPACSAGKARLCGERTAVNRASYEGSTSIQGTGVIMGKDYTIADISAWGWLDRASSVVPGDGDRGGIRI